MKKIGLLALWALLCVTSIYPVAYQAHLWNSPTKDSLLFIDDAHLEATAPIVATNYQQAEELSTFVLEHAIPVIIENSLAASQLPLSQPLQEKITTILEPHFKNATKDQLILLLEPNHLTRNIEHRQLRYKALDSNELHALDKELIAATIAEIEKYTDTHFLNNFYKTTLDTVARNYDHIEDNIDLLYYDAQLLDARILHEIFEYQIKPSFWNTVSFNLFKSTCPLIICAGAHHNKRVQEVLGQLGYTKMKTFGVPHSKVNSLNTISGQAIEYCDLNRVVDTKNNVAVYPLKIKDILRHELA